MLRFSSTTALLGSVLALACTSSEPATSAPGAGGAAGGQADGGGGGAGGQADGGGGGAGGGELPPEPGVARLDLQVSHDGFTMHFTECSFALDTAIQLKRASDAMNGKRYAEIECIKLMEDALGEHMRVGLRFHDDVVGQTIPAGDMSPNCAATGCEGPGRILVAFHDPHGGSVEEATSDTGTNPTGSFTLDAFDPDSGYVAGSLSASFGDGSGTSFSVAGTFEATLRDCHTTTPCTGDL